MKKVIPPKVDQKTSRSTDDKGASSAMEARLLELEQENVRIRLEKEQAMADIGKYRNIFENMEDVYYEASTEGTLTEIGRTIDVISRGAYTREDLLGRSLVSFYADPSDRTAFYDTLMSKGSVTDYDISLRNADGSAVHVAISSRLVNSKEGHPDKIIGSIRDITKRKQSEEQIHRLLNNENLLARISAKTLHSTNLNEFLNYSLSEMGKTLDVSRVYLFEHLYKTNTMTNTHEWCAPDIIPQIVELQGIPLDAMPWWIETLLNEQIICYSDIEDIPDEATREILRPQNILSILVVPIKTGGRYSGFIGFDDCMSHRLWERDKIDILNAISRIMSGFIEINQAREALEKSNQQLNIVNHQLEERVEERTREIFRLSNLQHVINENAGLAIISTNKDGVIQTFNSAAELMLGYKASEIVGIASPIFFHDRKELEAKASELSIVTGEKIEADFSIFSTLVNLMLTNTTEWQYRRKDNSCFPVKLTVSHYEAPDGSIGGYIGVAMDISKEKSAVKSLRESEERFHTMFHDHAAVMLLVNPETGAIVDANEAARNFYGYRFDEKNPLKMADINAFEKEQVKDLMLLAMTQKRNYFEFQHRLASGEIRMVEVHSTPIVMARESLLFSIIHDITDRKKIEAELRNNERTLTQITDGVPVLIALSNRNLEYTFANSAYEKFFNIGKSQIVGRKIVDILPAHIYEKAYPFLLKALEGETSTFENQLKNHKGEERNIQTTYLPYYQNNAIEGVLATVIDITERKAAAMALELKEKTLVQITDNVPVIISLLNLDLELTFANNAFESIFNVPEEGCIGKRLEEILGKNIYGKAFPNLQKALDGQIVTFENRLKDKHGALRILQITYTPYLQNGVISGVLTSAIDITDRVRSTEQLKRSENENAAILSAIPDLMFTLDKEGIFLSSHADSDASLYVAEELFLGKSIRETLPPEVSSLAVDALQRSFLTRETITFEYELFVNGQRRFYENRIHAISEDEALSIVRDISQRKQVEMALLWNEEFLKKMSESSPLAFLVVDNRTDEILFANHRFCEIWGITHLEEAIRNKELTNNGIIPDCLPVLKDVPAFAESCKPLQFESNRLVLEDEIPFVDGRTIRRFSAQIRDAMDQYHGRLYIFEDITVRKNSEQLVHIQRDLVSRLSATADLEEALTMTLESIFQIADIDAGGIYLLDEESDSLKLIVHKGVTADFLMDKSVYTSDSLHFKLVLEGKSIFGPYNNSVFPEVTNGGLEIFQGLAVVPILHEGKVIGSFNLGSSKSVSFYENIQSSIESLVMQIGGTISRIRTEKALLSSQQNFRLLFETIDDFMFILDTNAHILQTNSVVGKRLGYTNEELSTMHVLEVHPTDRRDEAGFIVGEMLAGRALYCPVPLEAKDGTQIPVETRVILGKWDGKDVLFGISRDITERVHAEAALRMQSSSFESFAFPIVITDKKGIIQWVNSSFTRLSGYSQEESIGKSNGFLLKSGKQDDAFYKDMWQTILSGNVWSGEIVNKKKDGTFYPEELTITPVHDFKGRIANFIAIKIDITSRKEFEESLRAAIAKEKELSELKSRFVSMASHEFRTPLASILIMGDSLLAYWKQMDEQQIATKLKNIKGQVQHLAKVVTDVMQVSKIQEGKLNFHPQEVEYVGLCQAVIKDFNNDILLENKILFDCQFESLPMFLDNRLMVQVLNNLISNAIKYAQPNPVVRIRLHQLEREILLSIEDNGIGIPESDQKNLFQPFFRAENAKQFHGNGLGLNIVRESVKLHGGEVTYETSVGKGSLFVVHLPKERIPEND